MPAKTTRGKVEVLSDDGAVLGKVSVSVARPPHSRATVVLAHGAGGTMETPSIVAVQKRLAAENVTAVRFNFLYSEKGKRAPDRQPVLLACWRSVADWVKRELSPKMLFLGGRSMGGRMVSYLVADGYECEGLVFLAYPLHPPGKRDRQRKEHLRRIEVPMLFVSGTRDTFAYLDLLEPVVKALKAKLHLIDGADHGFKVPKKLGKTSDDVDEEVVGVMLAFIDSVGG